MCVQPSNVSHCQSVTYACLFVASEMHVKYVANEDQASDVWADLRSRLIVQKYMQAIQILDISNLGERSNGSSERGNQRT